MHETIKFVKNGHKGAVKVSKRLSVKDIEKRIGIDEVEPIRLTPSDEADMKEKDEELRDWYEDELGAFYQQASKQNQK